MQHIHVTTVAMETQQCNVCNDVVHFTVNNTILSAAQKCLYGNDTSSTKMYLGLHEKHPVFLSNFNQILSFSTYFHTSTLY